MNNKRYIISTASLPAECLQQLAQQEFEAEAIPFIHTYPSVDEEAAQRIRELQKHKATVVFTSAHGVTPVAALLDQKPDWEIGCMAGATLDAVKTHFDKARVIATAANAKQLATEMVNYARSPVVFFCGNKRLDVLPQQLMKAGMEVEEIIVYHTRLTPQVVKRVADAVLFFSSSAVESFFELNVLAKTTVCFAIGETTAEALRQRVNNRIIIAGSPAKKQMIEQVIQYYNEHS